MFTNESLANPIASFVLDPMTGAELLPTSEALQAAMRASPDENKKETSPHCLWVAVSKKSIRMAINFNGERVAKVELEEEELAEAFYITRHGGFDLEHVGAIAMLMFRTKGLGVYHDERDGIVLLIAVLGVYHQNRAVLWSSAVSFLFCGLLTIRAYD